MHAGDALEEGAVEGVEGAFTGCEEVFGGVANAMLGVKDGSKVAVLCGDGDRGATKEPCGGRGGGAKHNDFCFGEVHGELEGGAKGVEGVELTLKASWSGGYAR